MKLKRFAKTCLVIAAFGVMALGMTACGGGSSDGGGDNAGTTLKFQQWWGAELPEGYLDQVVADFQEETGITVELLTAPWADTKTAIT